ncbi:hypothetical protein V6N12_007572 [Hibiscus sabdariffa]|uniref:DUF4283 domain-containing protein n=1 Tax=Hibiscus sabdariffa TaxID=183260 RepID=A0ABR2F253_9ROSI
MSSWELSMDLKWAHSPLIAYDGPIIVRMLYDQRYVQDANKKRWCNIWEVHNAFPKEAKSFFSCWIDVYPRRESLPIWKMAFFEVCWSIRWWFRAKWPRTAITITDLMANTRIWCYIKVVDVDGTKKDWVAPKVGYVKFNTNSAVRGSFGPTGIEDALKRS